MAEACSAVLQKILIFVVLIICGSITTFRMMHMEITGYNSWKANYEFLWIDHVHDVQG